MVRSKVWLLTGSSRGLGRAPAEVALEQDHHLVASARDSGQLEELRARFGKRVLPFAHDVTESRATNLAIEATIESFGRLDVLVNNAGYGNIGSVEDTSIEEIRSQIETNLFGTIYTTKAAIPFMRAQGAGHIVQFSSVGGRIGAIGRAAYSAAKWGIEGFSGSLSKEVGPLWVTPRPAWRPIAAVHQQVREFSDIGTVELDQYLTDLCQAIGTAASSPDRTWSLIVDAEPFVISTDVAVPLALIVNELITNGIQHSRPESSAAIVQIALKRNTDDFAISVSDSGDGPVVVQASEPVAPHIGLGSRPIESLASQIGATVIRGPAPAGYTITVTIPYPAA